MNAVSLEVLAGRELESWSPQENSGNSGNSSAPEPLRRSTPDAEPYPMAELGGILGPAAQAIRRVIQAPDAVIGGSLLAAASLASQAHADVHLDGRTIPLSLWLLSVAESGERKSAVDKEAMRAAREYERELSKLYDDAVEKYNLDILEWQACADATKQEARKVKGKGLADGIRSIGRMPVPPPLPRVTVADFTAEGLFKLLSAGRPSLGAFTDEAAQVFGGHGMSKEAVMRTAGAMCKLWDDGSLDRVRVGDGATRLSGTRLALHLLAQPVIAERALSDDVLAGQGFLARCLLAWPQGTAGTRPYVAENLRENAMVVACMDRLLELHRMPLPLADAERMQLEPRALRLHRDAYARWREVHDSIELQLGPEGQYAQVKPWASKASEQILRIAGVLTLVDQPNAQLIDAATIERAAEIALWHLSEARRLAGTAELSIEVRDAEALLEWAHATGRGFIYSTSALQLGPPRIRERERFKAAAAMLTNAGWAYPVEGGMTIDGAQRRHVWRIVKSTEGG